MARIMAYSSHFLVFAVEVTGVALVLRPALIRAARAKADVEVAVVLCLVQAGLTRAIAALRTDQAKHHDCNQHDLLKASSCGDKK